MERLMRGKLKNSKERRKWKTRKEKEAGLG
jgi:hypothetical protein